MLVVLGEYTRECLAIEVYRRMWGEEIGTGALHIDPGSPWQTGIVASFNGRLRNELLSSAILDTLVEARHLIDRWRPFYNYRRIPRARGEVIPATFAANPAGAGRGDTGNLCGEARGAASAPAQCAREGHLPINNFGEGITMRADPSGSGLGSYNGGFISRGAGDSRLPIFKLR